jgi:hypothetical protein
MSNTVRPRQVWSEVPALREVQDAGRAAAARQLSRQLMPFGPVAQLVRTNSVLKHSVITPVDPTDAGGLLLYLPRATMDLAGATVVIVNNTDDVSAITVQTDGRDLIDGATTKSIGGAGRTTTILTVVSEGNWKVMV